ncbi:hypothetical protein IKG31_01680 [Candidatus Saccharibacteria bacterium]|nr:hypothetical protein [Candidatus Saccharibacteria bacterium]
MASDFIFIRKGRNALSTFLHFALNILLGVGSVFVTIVSGSWIIGFVLVLLSKWRMFAVRPRYLWLNIKSNLVDLIVGFSFVLLAYFSGSTVLPVHYILAASYAFWLTIIKPKTAESWTLVQALCATFLGTTAASIMCASFSSAILVILEFIIGYSATRHVLAQNDNMNDAGYPALIFGTIFAEIALLCHSWLIVYTFTNAGIIIPQLSVILTIFSFMAERILRSVEKHDGQFRLKDITAPLIFSLIVLSVIIIGFSEPIFNV